MIDCVEVSVCRECSKLGKPVRISYTLKLKSTGQSTSTIHTVRRKTYLKAAVDVEKSIESYNLVENYNLLVKNARERMGLSHEELGAKLGEKASVIRKIEQGKLKPDNILAKKLEHFLKIKLLVPPSEIKTVGVSKAVEDHGLTIGDFLKKEDKKTNTSE